MPRLIDADAIPWCNYDLDNYHPFEGVDKDVVDEMPTIDPESLRPHGRWVESLVLRTDMSALYQYTCSECAIISNRESNYCPNCGAKMDLEE